MILNVNDEFGTPKNLIGVLEHRPANKSELLTYVANWKVYADHLLAQAKESKILVLHPLRSEVGQQQFVAEITRLQETYNVVGTDLRRSRFDLRGDEMRRIGGIFQEATLIMEQAFAILKMAG